jgi:hypothetical protein
MQKNPEGLKAFASFKQVCNNDNEIGHDSTDP